MFLLFVGETMPLNQQRMVGKCFDMRPSEGMCMCACACPLLKKTTQPSVYLAASFHLCLACEREIHLQIFLAVKLLYLYWSGTNWGVLFQGCRSPLLWYLISLGPRVFPVVVWRMWYPRLPFFHGKKGVLWLQALAGIRTAVCTLFCCYSVMERGGNVLFFRHSHLEWWTRMMQSLPQLSVYSHAP